MPTKKPSVFFKAVKRPYDWSIAEYLNFDHGQLLPRRILDEWSKSLQHITKSSDKEFSHVHRKRAVELLKRYKEKVGIHRRLFGRTGLKHRDLQREATGSEDLLAPHPDTIVGDTGDQFAHLYDPALYGPLCWQWT